jgi:hypothetical protein
VKSQSKPGGGARLDLMRLCPEPAAYELGFTQMKDQSSLRLPRYEGSTVFIKTDLGDLAALVAVDKGVTPPSRDAQTSVDFQSNRVRL